MAAISHTGEIRAKSPASLGLHAAKAANLRGKLPIIVREKPPQIVAPHGLSHRERDVLTEGLDFLRRQGPGFWVSVEAGKAPEAEKTVRDLVSRVRSDIALYQGRGGMRKKHAVTVFEALGRDGSPKFNGHVVAIARDAAHRDKIIQALNGSKAYGKNILADPVTEWEKVTTYLLKEATQQAQYRRDFRRIGGSIPLGELGGNRVIPSDDLKNTLISKGAIKPFSRTYAARVLPVSIEVSAEKAVLPAQPVAIPDPHGLFGKLPEQATPGKEWARSGPRRLKLTIEGQANLPLERQPDVIDLMARLGQTHEAIAARIGALSRPQATNILNRQFGCSRYVARRVLQLAKAA